MRDVRKIIETYDKTAAHYAKSRLGTEPKEALEKFIKIVTPLGKVLDVGCAGGRDSRILKDGGLDVFGIDLSVELLKIAKEQNPDIKFVLSDMRHTLFVDNYFDGVWASAVLHHLDKSEMAPTIQEFWRILKPDGILYVSAKKGKGILKMREEMMLNKEREFTLLEKEELDQMLTGNGFKKIELYSRKALSRELYWVCAFYRKV